MCQYCQWHSLLLLLCKVRNYMLKENHSLHDWIENRPSLLFNKYQSKKWWTLLYSILHDFENGLPFAINHLWIPSRGFAINLEQYSHEIQITKRLFPNIFNILFNVSIIKFSAICHSCFFLKWKILRIFHKSVWNNFKGHQKIFTFLILNNIMVWFENRNIIIITSIEFIVFQ